MGAMPGSVFDLQPLIFDDGQEEQSGEPADLAVDYSKRRADGYRKLLIAAIERFEAARTVRVELEAGSPPYPKGGNQTPAEEEERKEWKYLGGAADVNLNEMEEALARLVSYGYNALVHPDLIVCEETEESIGQGVVYKGIAYSLSDVVGNSCVGIIHRVEIGRMAMLDDPSAAVVAPGQDDVNEAKPGPLESDYANADVNHTAERTVRFLAAQHQAAFALLARAEEEFRHQKPDCLAVTDHYWERWIAIAHRAATSARDVLAVAVAATSDGDMDIKGLIKGDVEPFPTASVDMRDLGLILVRPDPHFKGSAIPEIIFADLPAFGDNICP